MVDDPHDSSTAVEWHESKMSDEWREEHGFKGEKRDPPGSWLGHAVFFAVAFWGSLVAAAFIFEWV